MTNISQWVNFILEKQISRLLYCYLFQIPNYFIVYFDGFDSNSCWKCLFVDDGTERTFICFLSNI